MYLPGAPVSAGDLVLLLQGRTGLLRPQKPYGALEVVGNLRESGLDVGELLNDRDPDPHIFASRGGSKVSFTADASGVTGAGTNVSGTLDISPTKENLGVHLKSGH